MGYIGYFISDCINKINNNIANGRKRLYSHYRLLLNIQFSDNYRKMREFIRSLVLDSP